MTADEITLVRETIHADADSVTDATILMWWTRGTAILQNQTGTTIDFEKDAEAKGLLVDFCRYAYNNATEYFTANFREPIQQLVWREAVKDHANQSTSNAEVGNTP